jgi:hypothetical protein
LVRGHRPAGAALSGKRGRHTPILAHQLASAKKKLISVQSKGNWYQSLMLLGGTRNNENRGQHGAPMSVP